MAATQSTTATAGSAAGKDFQDMEFRAPLSSDSRMPEQSEDLFRLLCRMWIACQVLEVPTETRFTSLVLLHRYAQQADHQSITSMVAAACLLLGCKAEDDSRRLRDIINLEYMILDDSIREEQQQQNDEKRKSAREIRLRSKPLALNETYWGNKEKLVSTEHDVLRLLKFDVTVSHPHRAVALVLLEGDTTTVPSAPMQQLLRASWRYIDRSLFYSPALSHAVLPMACAAILMALEEEDERPEEWSRWDPRKNSVWWHEYSVKDLALEFARRDLQLASDLYTNKNREQSKLQND